MPSYQMTRNNTFKLDVQVLAPPPGSPPGTPAQPANITGWKMWFTAKRNFSDPDSYAVFQGTILDGSIVVSDALSGKVTVTMPAISTKDFPDLPTTLVYDVTARDASGNVNEVESGTLVVNPSVTRTTS